MIPAAVMERYHLQSERYRDMRLYALVDGFQYQKHTGSQIGSQPEITCALFAGTKDEPLAHAGPWLIDLARASAPQVATLAGLEAALPSVVWLITGTDIGTLAARLRPKLDARLPDGTRALLRFWDPRVLDSLCRSLARETRREFFGNVQEWDYMVDGKRYHLTEHA